MGPSWDLASHSGPTETDPRTWNLWFVGPHDSMSRPPVPLFERPAVPKFTGSGRAASPDDEVGRCMLRPCGVRVM